ncbi:3,4-dihydroxy-2-butanone-4-phosphate synthase [Corynebacterium jeikeium]|uniref:3,4-dihydroxy-2-butanone-4-phosphate synthase n=1 Tax=Corynebacterium jeikeium TaxID=38289 RepID=UPI00054FA244|nr:3,4-dihydroxy-2-butanone-4-phosphate synthase [Corynebacterium jeikeium]
MTRMLTDIPQTNDTKTTARLDAETHLTPIEDIVADIAAGKMVVLVDDEDRENEGDLIMAAEAITPETVNFMITQGKGLLCVPMTAEHARTLNLAPMVERNEDDFGTSFTVSCDAIADFGITTGISASDRAATINLLASGGVASNFHRPGHVFPLMAREGGVLTRIGHTEAGSDLAAMAGFAPVGAIVEIIGDDGEMLRLPQLVEWCAERGIALSTIERLRTYRQEQVAAGVAITQRPDGSPLATPLTSVK